MIKTAANAYKVIANVQELDSSCIEHGREIFNNYKQEGIILDSHYDDDRWQLCDEYSKVGIHFNFDEVSYQKFYRELLMLPFKVFVLYAKTYVMYTMGKMVLSSLQDTINDMKRLFSCNPDDLYSDDAYIFITHPNRIIEFISMLPIAEKDERLDMFLGNLDDIISLRYSHIASNQRMLASFDSYFLFNDIMNDFWEAETDQDTRLFYFPLYLWWQVTAIIPLRPREFILTPRNCLEKKEDGYYITLRRNLLKGSSGKVAYRIEDDYFKVQYKIPNKLANEINNYINITAAFAPTELETLFISDPHYKHWNHKKHSNSRYFTYINLNCVMRYFFHDIIEEKYHLEVVYDRSVKHLRQGQINYLYLGDTRHLALINLISEGGTPFVAMMLAGHENLEMSSHYYSNITELIECQTYSQYRKVLKGNITYNISPCFDLPGKIREFHLMDDGGRCYSESFFKGDFSDCLKAVGTNGEIGFCPTCSHYARAGRDTFYDKDDIYKRKIEDDCIYLKNIVKQVRLGLGSGEDIMQAFLRLQSSSVTFRNYMQEKTKFITETGENVWEEN